MPKFCFLWPLPALSSDLSVRTPSRRQDRESVDRSTEPDAIIRPDAARKAYDVARRGHRRPDDRLGPSRARALKTSAAEGLMVRLGAVFASAAKLPSIKTILGPLRVNAEYLALRPGWRHLTANAALAARRAEAWSGACQGQSRELVISHCASQGQSAIALEQSTFCTSPRLCR